MPRQNRVTPCGEIIAAPDRGMYMGNRGTLHDASGHLTSQRWTRKAWVTCLLSFKDRYRKVMAPGQYTELFFLDEATALAAGHRPCATCRRDDYSRFTQLWAKANAQRLDMTNPSIADIDNTLHQERFISSGWQDGWRPSLKDLPDGAIAVLDDPKTAWLVWENELLEWSPRGYRSRIERRNDLETTVLTPRSIVAVLAAGYVPAIHPTASLVQEGKAIRPAMIAPAGTIPKASEPESQEKSPRVSHRDLSTVQQVAATNAPTGALYKLRNTPAGKDLFTYTAAILKVTGMDQGKVYPLKKFLGNFSGHVSASRIKKVPGGYQLTPTGIEYFNDRYNPGSRQHVNRSEVDTLAKLICHGGGTDWVPVS
jgi:hypothetical protein